MKYVMKNSSTTGNIGLNQFICEFNGKMAGAKKAGAHIDENYAVEIFLKASVETMD